MTVLPVPVIDALPDVPWKEKLAYLSFMFHQLPQVDCPLTHAFENDQYVRYIEIPKGTLFIGRVHKIGHVVELNSGSVIHVRETCRRLVHAPFTMTTKPGDQVCALALTDIKARTVHPLEGERDVPKLEERWFESLESLNALGAQVDERMRRKLYERDSSGSRRFGGDWGSRLRCCRI